MQDNCRDLIVLRFLITWSFPIALKLNANLECETKLCRRIQVTLSWNLSWNHHRKAKLSRPSCHWCWWVLWNLSLAYSFPFWKDDCIFGVTHSVHDGDDTCAYKEWVWMGFHNEPLELAEKDRERERVEMIGTSTSCYNSTIKYVVMAKQLLVEVFITISSIISSASASVRWF